MLSPSRSFSQFHSSGQMSPSRPNTPFQSSSSLASSSAAQSPPKVGVFQSFHMRALAIIVLTVVVHTVITWNWVQT
eukprot:gene22851-27885_t